MKHEIRILTSLNTAIVVIKEPEIFLISLEDIDLVKRWRWRCSNNYYLTRDGKDYTVKPVKSFKVTLHKIIVERMGLDVNNKWIDHINRNPKDNRRNNLRVVTYQENCMNRGISKANTSGYKGVVWVTADQKWRSQIKINGKNIVLGYHDDPKEGGILYNKAAYEHYGNIAYLNEID